MAERGIQTESGQDLYMDDVAFQSCIKMSYLTADKPF